MVLLQFRVGLSLYVIPNWALQRKSLPPFEGEHHLSPPIASPSVHPDTPTMIGGQ